MIPTSSDCDEDAKGPPVNSRLSIQFMFGAREELGLKSGTVRSPSISPPKGSGQGAESEKAQSSSPSWSRGFSHRAERGPRSQLHLFQSPGTSTRISFPRAGEGIRQVDPESFIYRFPPPPVSEAEHEKSRL